MPWIAEVGDHAPFIDVSWSGSRPVDSIKLSLSSLAARPTKVSIAAPGGKPTIVSVPRDGGLITFPKVVTDSLVIRFVRVTNQALIAPNLIEGLRLPVGLSSISVPGLVTTPVARPDMNTRFTLSCGRGPSLQIDGKTWQTSSTGTVGDLINLETVPITLSAKGGLRLSTGTHTFGAEDPFGPFEVTSLVLQPIQTTESAGIPQRTASVQQWGAETRVIRVGPGPATYVVVSQNYNSAWTATMGGHPLKSIRVDGWEQGYLVPAGGSGIVTLSVPANSLYELLLVLGGVLLVGLFLLALLPSRRRQPTVTAPRKWPSFWVLFALSVAALAVISGPLALVLVPLLVIGRRWGPGPLAVTAFSAFTVAGIAAAWHPANLFGLGIGAFEPLAQIASVVALAAVLGSFVADGWTKAPSAVADETDMASITGDASSGANGGPSS